MATVFRLCLGVLREKPLCFRTLRRCSTEARDGSSAGSGQAESNQYIKRQVPKSQATERRTSSTGSQQNNEGLFAPPEYRFIYPEFLPDKDPSMRHKIRERLEMADMLQRRRVINIPEFYVGSILAVNATDRCAPGKLNRFVGICIHRSGYGLRATFILRNVIDHQGVEIMYELYNPCIRSIEVLKLEKRLDDELFYLRDALPEYSTISFDIVPTFLPEGAPIPINPTKVKLKPRPWHERWERKNLKGVQDLELPERFYQRARELATPWEKYDLMKEYRRLIPEEEQQEIYAEVYKQEKELGKKKQVKKFKSVIDTKT